MWKNFKKYFNNFLFVLATLPVVLRYEIMIYDDGDLVFQKSLLEMMKIIFCDRYYLRRFSFEEGDNRFSVFVNKPGNIFDLNGAEND